MVVPSVEASSHSNWNMWPGSLGNLIILQKRFTHEACVCVCVWNCCEMLYYLKENMVYQSPKFHVWELRGLDGTKIHYWCYSQTNCTTVQQIKPVNGDSKSWTNHLIWDGIMSLTHLRMSSLTCKWLRCYLNFRIWAAKAHYWTWKIKNFEIRQQLC